MESGMKDTQLWRDIENALLGFFFFYENVDRFSCLDLQVVHNSQVVLAATKSGENPQIHYNRAKKYREYR